jgi:histidinol-phosphatase (PHP family)
VAEERGISELGVAEHIHRFTQSLDVWQHPWWQKWARDDVDEYCAFVREETDLRLGIEADFVAGREDRLANFLDAREWDYVVGSVHFIADEAVDMDDWSVWGRGESAEKVWRRYFETGRRGGPHRHVRHHGPPRPGEGVGRRRPGAERRPARYYEPAIEGFLEGGVAVEVSTAGLRKPVGEIYPSRSFLEEAVGAGLPVALSSDAHTPDQLGFRYEDALELLEQTGVSEICVFEGRQRRLEPVG